MHHSGDSTRASITIARSVRAEEEETMFPKVSVDCQPPVMIPTGNSDHFVNCNIVLAIKWPESLDLKQNSHLEDEAHLDKVIELFTYKALLETRDCKQKS